MNITSNFDRYPEWDYSEPESQIPEEAAGDAVPVEPEIAVAESAVVPAQNPPPASSWRDSVKKCRSTASNLCLAYSLADRGFANLFALSTLKHGTSALSYLSIYRHGADPRRGGSMEGVYTGLNPLSRTCQNYFYVMPDPNVQDVLSRNWDRIDKRLRGPSSFVTMANQLMLGITRSDQLSIPTFCARFLSSVFLDNVTPLLKFKFKPEEVIDPSNRALGFRFEYDPAWEGIALRTAHSISPRRLGLTGSLLQVGPDAVERMRQHPMKVLSGGACLLLTSLILKHTYQAWQNTTPVTDLAEVYSLFREKCIAFPKRIVTGVYHYFRPANRLPTPEGEPQPGRFAAFRQKVSNLSQKIPSCIRTGVAAIGTGLSTARFVVREYSNFVYSRQLARYL